MIFVINESMTTTETQSRVNNNSAYSEVFLCWSVEQVIAKSFNNTSKAVLRFGEYFPRRRKVMSRMHRRTLAFASFRQQMPVALDYCVTLDSLSQNIRLLES